MELEIKQETSEYRLCRKKNGEMVLQRLFIVSKRPLNPANFEGEPKAKWVDLETVSE